MCGLIKENEIEKRLAKSSGITIEVHNNHIFSNLNIIKKRIGIDENIEKYLKEAIKYHDYGKSY